jgi:PPOX class probable F420-dependent enzyme
MPITDQIQQFLDSSRNGILATIRRDGVPHLTPNWFSFDGEYIYISTTRTRAKYRFLQRDPRVAFIVDDSLEMKYVSLRGSVEIREDIENYLPIFRRTRELVGVAVPPDAEFLSSLLEDDRVLLVITPDGPIETWTTKGFDQP